MQKACAALPLPYSTPGISPCARRRRASAVPCFSRDCTCSLIRSPAIGGPVYRRPYELQIRVQHDQQRQPHPEREEQGREERGREDEGLRIRIQWHLLRLPSQDVGPALTLFERRRFCNPTG